ncbi:hypothetical protein I4U23_005578 [Adineta vaga]|nr:hypothetical protein I4U23_005578 [Adineta vaga]
MIFLFICALFVCFDGSLEAENGCVPNPCANNASCTVVDLFDYNCKCPEDLPVDENPDIPQANCKVNSCQNGGYCDCASMYMKAAELYNTGICIALENNPFHYHCPSNFNGSLCQNRILGSITDKKTDPCLSQ